MVAVDMKFQSTRPHGARQLQLCDAFRQGCFNPRARTGRDDDDDEAPTSSGVSIHAPARGATAHRLPAYLGAEVSIHAPARGATLGLLMRRIPLRFQSTRPHGARREG